MILRNSNKFEDSLSQKPETEINGNVPTFYSYEFKHT